MCRYILPLLLLTPWVCAAEPAPDWSKFTKHADVDGVIVSGDANHIVLQVPKLEKKNTGTRSRNNKTTIGHEEIEYSYAAQGLARRKEAPSFTDDKGNKRSATTNELEKLKLPIGAPGYAMEKTDLKAGHLVTVTLVRPTSVTAEKATKNDIVIKYVLVTGETKAPADAKKKN